MADTQLSLTDGMKAELLETNENFRQLVFEHQALDQQIRHLSNLSYLTNQQQYEARSLKKKKLALKDRIETFVRQQRGLEAQHGT